jgi:hypothetical protein
MMIVAKITIRTSCRPLDPLPVDGDLVDLDPFPALLPFPSSSPFCYMMRVNQKNGKPICVSLLFLTQLGGNIQQYMMIVAKITVLTSCRLLPLPLQRGKYFSNESSYPV